MFHPIIQEWFRERFGEPTEVQKASWPAIEGGSHVLIAAPTGSGKTLAAFLTCLDRLLNQALARELDDHIQVVYVSPLKALSHDVRKNLQEPLTEITERAISAGQLLPPLRVEVRTGDTPASVRQRQLRRPPHILVTTPESLYLLLTSAKSRPNLRQVKTVIVDEIHAVAGNKRGTHLALSLERLAALCASPPLRIGLSATQRPLEAIARFLVGESKSQSPRQDHDRGPVLEREGVLGDCRIVDVGHHRRMDLAVEVPGDELGAVATNAIWTEIYDRLAELARIHRSTLIFVNTRRLAERVAHHLAQRLGEEQVASHHGSLSRKIRLSVEERLKEGDLRVMVATASLELGIDIGFVDLVCQIGSPRAISTCIQRIGRSGHWVGALPKGRLFCTTREELVECAAVVQAMAQGHLDPVTIPVAPIDILAQQIVAEVAAREWDLDALWTLCRQAFPYRDLTRSEFEAIIGMLAEGYVPGRRRGQAHLFYDRVQGRVRPRRGARLAALTSGGAIPDAATYAVVAEPEGLVVGSVDEDFAVESLAGDIILLGTTSWRIRGVETGKLRVEDARGAPPTIPFWRGEAPSRSAELSSAVGELREQVSRLLHEEGGLDEATVLAWLHEHCGLAASGAQQVVAYIREGRRILGAVPTQTCIIAERFFDESGGMQLVIHAPFGGRVNRAWGLALRKRFCLNFDFELQAAATDDGLVLSLGEKHSFPLPAIFSFLHSGSVREVLTQALLASPLFLTRWRWNVSRALALLRFQKGKKVPLHLQRMRAEDLLAAAFPLATACQDNHVGDIPLPDHPLVRQTVEDCLQEAMDVEGLTRILRQIEQGEITCVAVETPAPSPFAHEILNAHPFAFLDDAPLEERRARAVNLRQTLPDHLGGEVGLLDPAVIEEVVQEAWPRVRDADELQEALHGLVWLPEELGREWKRFLPPLLESSRAVVVEVRWADATAGRWIRGWATVDHVPVLQRIFPEVRAGVPSIPDSASSGLEGLALDPDAALTLLVRGWMECRGPLTSREVADLLALPLHLVQRALAGLEAEGQVLRGVFRPSTTGSSRGYVPSETSGLHGARTLEGEGPAVSGVEAQNGVGHSGSRLEAPADVQWCDRRLLARMHRRTVQSLRREIEPVSAADFMRFLFQWQHRSPGSQLHGEAGLREVVAQLAGFEAPASSWEHSIFKERVVAYQPELLDRLCLRGDISWGRLSLPLRESALDAGGDGGQGGKKASEVPEAGPSLIKRITPNSLAPLTFFQREDFPWLATLARRKMRAYGLLAVRQALSAVALDILECLERHGACFFSDLRMTTRHLPSQLESALWELVAAGFVTADGFDALRALLDPKRRRAEGKDRSRTLRHSVGRWAVLPTRINSLEGPPGLEDGEYHESWARQLLRRYGVVFRDLLGRESLPLSWRELLAQYRRMEWRGEIRGGRFVDGFTGEQFALPEAVETLRAVRRMPAVGELDLNIAPADPLNLVGVILPGDRVSPHGSRSIVFRRGVPVNEPATVAVMG